MNRHKLKFFLAGLLPTFCVGVLLGFVLVADARQHQVQKWPGQEITVYDQSGFRPSLRVALHQWQNAGLGVRFVLTNNPRADVKVIVDREACGKNCGGLAAWTGYRPAGQQKVMLPRKPNANERRHATYYMTRVLVHELGHVLGLPHRAGCSVMSESFERDCGIPNGATRLKVCGPLRVDIEAAKAIYGSKSWPYAPTGCQEKLI